MPARASNRKALEEVIRKHYKMSAFNTCKRQHWPVTAGPPMIIHTPEDAVPMYCRKPTKVPRGGAGQGRPAQDDLRNGVGAVHISAGATRIPLLWGQL